MNTEQREIQRQLRVLKHAELTEKISRTCRYFGTGRATFYRWRKAYREHGEAGLKDARPGPDNHPNKTPAPH